MHFVMSIDRGLLLRAVVLIICHDVLLPMKYIIICLARSVRGNTFVYVSAIFGSSVGIHNMCS